MPVAEPLQALLGELDAMTAEDRAAILGSLTRKERAKLALVSERRRASAAPVLDGHSPWLAARLEAVRQGDPVVTPAVRDILSRAVGAPARDVPPIGRSLAGAFGGLLSSRGAVR